MVSSSFNDQLSSQTGPGCHFWVKTFDKDSLKAGWERIVNTVQAAPVAPAPVAAPAPAVANAPKSAAIAIMRRRVILQRFDSADHFLNREKESTAQVPPLLVAVPPQPVPPQPDVDIRRIFSNPHLHSPVGRSPDSTANEPAGVDLRRIFSNPQFHTPLPPASNTQIARAGELDLRHIFSNPKLHGAPLGQVDTAATAMPSPRQPIWIDTAVPSVLPEGSACTIDRLESSKCSVPTAFTQCVGGMQQTATPVGGNLELEWPDHTTTLSMYSSQETHPAQTLNQTLNLAQRLRGGDCLKTQAELGATSYPQAVHDGRNRNWSFSGELPVLLERRSAAFRIDTIMASLSHQCSRGCRPHDIKATPSLLQTINMLDTQMCDLRRQLEEHSWQPEIEGALRVELNRDSGWLRGHSKRSASAWLSSLDQLRVKDQEYTRLKQGLVYMSLMQVIGQNDNIRELVMTSVIQCNREEAQMKRPTRVCKEDLYLNQE